MLTDSQPSPAAKNTARSRITNGSKLLSGIDGRTRLARRLRDIQDELLSELGRAPTQEDMILAREIAALTVRSEGLQAAIVKGEEVNMQQAIAASNQLRRLLRSLSRRGRA